MKKLLFLIKINLHFFFFLLSGNWSGAKDETSSKKSISVEDMSQVRTPPSNSFNHKFHSKSDVSVVKAKYRGWSDTAVNLTLALHMVDSNLIPSTHYGPLNLFRSDS